ncbi:MAG: PilZ domain-containing protein [Candidatus Omnitrophica bacterium]|nr:PilZ domain-containing protein [Candidatus Omnitrophota bacterium]
MDQKKYAGQERRQTHRVDAHIPCRIAHEDGDIVAETVNVSRSGAYCRLDRRIGIMTKLKIQILLPVRKGEKNLTKTIQCQGVVVRVEPCPETGHYNIAVFFNEISQRDAAAIDDYVHSCAG